ncbi:LysR family transcriptional regulator [Brenneria goodwinii]|nr:LysR family transcriptional regulator [Brenneria goodwinii]MCG8166195.1 LysR family transcriptional regulator [Brenneria goodwinii]MCG8175038.1 LysR family transcriptional regulator [Brenneria goodwinii]
MPNWNDLRIFLQVVRSGSLSGAGKALRVDVSTISRHITSLEKAIGTPMFERHPSGLKITPGGNKLIAHIEAMEAQTLAMIGKTSAQKVDELAGEVRIGTMEGIASFYLAEQLVDFKRRYPGIRVELLTSSYQVHVNRREADLFLSFYPYESQGLDILPVGKFSLYLYASDKYWENQVKPVSVDELRQHKFISYIDDLVQLDTVRWLNECIDTPNVVFSSSSMVAQMFSAAAGAGIVMLPEFMHAERFGLKRLLEKEVNTERTVWLSVHRELRYLPKMKAVISFLVEILNRDYPTPAGIKISNENKIGR